MPTPFPFSFGINEFTTQPWRFEDDVTHYAALGVDAIEVCEAKLDAGRVAEQFALIAEKGLRISALQPLVRTFHTSQLKPLPEGLQARCECLIQTIHRYAPYTPDVPYVVNTGAATDGNLQRVIDDTVRALKTITPIAADHGVQLSLEPLSPTSLNAETAIWTLNQAMDILDAVDHPALGLCLDIWNIWQQADLDDALIRAVPHTNVLQVSDWRVPRSSGDRLIPGEGEIPLGSLLHRIHQLGFRGACTVEIFSNHVADSLYDQDLNSVIQRSRSGLETAWQQHF